MPITITIKRDGPYRLEGDLSEITLVTHDGQPISLEGKKGVSLCRCGASGTKPFCDGTHSKIGFRGAEQAAREFDAARAQTAPGTPVVQGSTGSSGAPDASGAAAAATGPESGR